jgi:hypothetical protein
VFGVALLGAKAASPDAPALPDSFWKLPSDIRDRATVVVSGRFRVSRGPCEFLPDGSRRWALLRGFTPTVVHRGDVRSDYIGVESPRIQGSEDADAALVEGEEYLLVLRPSGRSMTVLRRREGSRSHRDALPPEEVLAIVRP